MIRLQRVFDNDDLSHDVYEMQGLCFPGEALLSVAVDQWWVALRDDEAAGFCCLSPSQSQPGGGYMSYAGVHPEHRGHGIQSLLIRSRVRRARQMGLSVLVTDTTDNIPSANNVMAAGFRLYQPRNPWGMAATLYWRLNL